MESPRFVIEEITDVRRWQRKNELAAFGARGREPTPQEDATAALEARLYRWLLYNQGELVAASLGSMFLQDCHEMVTWMNGSLGLEVIEEADSRETARPEATEHEWVPLQPFFEVRVRAPNVYRSRPSATWWLVNGGEVAAASTIDLVRPDCLDFVAWLQDETDIPLAEVKE